MGYYKQLDALRCYAVLWVVFSHLPLIHLSHNFLIFFNFIPGVPLFFAISGFLITEIILRNSTFSNITFFKYFYIRRALRIFPIYYLIVLLLFIVNPLLYRSTWFLTDFFYLSNFKIGFLGSFDSNSITPHFWSLAVEEQFYLIWPALIFFIKKPINKMLVAIIFLFIGVSSCLFFDSFFIDRTIGNYSYLGIGCVISIYNFYNKGRLEEYRKVINLSLFFIFSLAIVFSIYAIDINNFLFFLVSFLFISIILLKFIIGFNFFIIKTFIENRIILYIGKISYGIYLYHLFSFFILALIDKAFHLNLNGNYSLISSIKIILSIIISIISWEFFEKKINSIKNKFDYR